MKNFSKKPDFIRNLFNSIAPNYDKLNNLMSFGLHKRIKKEAISKLNLVNNPKILDLCTGTGDLSALLKEEYPTARIIGIDFSAKMLEIARTKHKEIEFLEANCMELPFREESFDLCIISFGLRNVENIQKVLEEIYRVLKKGGYFINIDLGKPNKILNLFCKPYMYFWVALLGKLFHGDETPYKYLAVSNEKFPSQKELVEKFKSFGFSKVKNRNYLLGQIASQRCQKIN